MINRNKILWKKLHEQARFCPLYPHERTIQFIFGNFPRSDAGKFKILDFGCGAGRHLLFLAENGYQAYGADVSEPGILVAEQRLRDRKLRADLKILRGSKLNYSDNYFDGIVGFGVLYYLSGKVLDVVVPELKRILKKGGRAFFTLRSKRDYRINNAVSLGNGDYKIIGDKKSRVENEAGMLMHFFDRKEIKNRFSGFPRIWTDEMLNTYNDGTLVDHDYIIELIK
jgi:SAM-dependent methyltransferase